MADGGDEEANQGGSQVHEVITAPTRPHACFHDSITQAQPSLYLNQRLKTTCNLATSGSKRDELNVIKQSVMWLQTVLHH